jgi:peptidoglycan/xylan/chitin deacetylase (PgdA/CDA1 family)
MTVLRAAFKILAPRGGRSRLTVLIFHRVLPAFDPLLATEPDAAEFERRMRWIRDWFNVVPLTEAVRGLSSGCLPERPLSITFDDGYADNVNVALPILSRLGLHATFFVATGFLDGGRMWNDTVIEAIRAHQGDRLDFRELNLRCYQTASIDDRRSTIDALLLELRYKAMDTRIELVHRIARIIGHELPDDLMMTSHQVAELHGAGMGIGAHTVNHPILASLDTSIARSEIANSKADLERIIGQPVKLFAYPNGVPGQDYNREHVCMVRELGFEGAVSTAWGVSRHATDVYQLPRFTPWDTAPWKYGARLVQNLFRVPSAHV